VKKSDLKPLRNSGCLSAASFLNFRRKGGFLADLFQQPTAQSASNNTALQNKEATTPQF